MTVGVRQAINPFDIFINDVGITEESPDEYGLFLALQTVWEGIYLKIEEATETFQRRGWAERTDEAPPLAKPHLIRTEDVNREFAAYVDLYKQNGGIDLLHEFPDFVTDIAKSTSREKPQGKIAQRDGTSKSIPYEQHLKFNSDILLGRNFVSLRGNPRGAFNEWKTRLHEDPTLPPEYRVLIEGLSFEDAEQAWINDKLANNNTDENEYFDSFIDSSLDPVFRSSGIIMTTEENDIKETFKNALADHPEIDLRNLTSQQDAILKKHTADLQFRLENAKSEAPNQVLSEEARHKVIMDWSAVTMDALLNPAKEPLSYQDIQDIFNVEGLNRFGTTLGDLRQPPNSDEQYLLRLALSKSLEEIQARQAVGEPFDFMGIVNNDLDTLPDAGEISRRQELRFGRMPPGTVLVGEGAVAPRTVMPAVNALDTKTRDIMREQSEIGDPISFDEAKDIARLEMGDEAPPIEMDIPEEPPQITAETENLRRYNALQVILDMDDDNPQKQLSLMQFVTDEGLSQRLLQGKPVLDAEGNQVLDADGKPAFTDAPINEAAVVMAAVQEGAMGAIIRQRDQQVGKSLEDVQSQVKTFDELDANVQNAAKQLGINTDEYAGGNQILDDLITLRDEGQEAGMLAKEQLVQRGEEEQIREEGFPVDITQLPSSEEAMAVGGASASAAYLEAQEKERQRQAQMAASAQRRAEADAATRTIGGRLGA